MSAPRGPVVSFIKTGITTGIAAGFALLSLAVLAPSIRAQGNFKIGVLPFVDDTGANAANLADSVSRAVQAEIVHTTQLQGRVLALDPGVNPNSVDAAKAVSLGQAQNVDVVVVGTVLEAHAESSSSSANTPSIHGFSLGGSKQTMKGTVTLQGDLYSTSTGQKIDSIRVTGEQSQTKIGADTYTDLGSLSTGGANFDNSTIGKAFHKAVSDLVKRINSEQGQMAHYTGGGAAAGGAAAASGAASSAPAGGAGGSSASDLPGSPYRRPGSPSTGASAVAPAGAQPELKSVRIDFVPGERTIFFDDFSDMAEDEPPPHWKVRGAPVELRTGGGIRELYSAGDTTQTSPTLAVPANFTLEVERTGTGDLDFEFRSKDDVNLLDFEVYQAENKSGLTYRVSDSKEPLGTSNVQVDFAKPLEVALWMQQGRVRAYVNGERVVDVNQVTFPPIDHLTIERRWHTVSATGYLPTGIRSVRLAESAPDFSAAIASAGKYVTHGIYFDTDSDRLKPESAPIIKQVAAALEKNPALKLEIDGYTDSVGDANHNLDLSKRRAQAVQSVLVAQFGVDASRLSANGMGAGNPIGSNDTAEGRAANRRVEFVKK